ncbi:MAG: hypothetical protein NUV67_04735 [archaeon]|nr:hypothetical protein [archaeon]
MVSDLHHKVLRNMEAEAQRIERDLDKMDAPLQKNLAPAKIPRKGFVSKIMGFFKR